MRTSVHIPDDLLKRAKQKAAAEGRTLTSLIEEGLRTVLSDTGRENRRRNRVDLIVSSVSDGVQPGVDLTSHSTLQELMDEDVVREAGIVKLR